MKERYARVVAGPEGNRHEFIIPAELAGHPEAGKMLDEMVAEAGREACDEVGCKVGMTDEELPSTDAPSPATIADPTLLLQQMLKQRADRHVPESDETAKMFEGRGSR